jgi:hypothetical protein
MSGVEEYWAARAEALWRDYAEAQLWIEEGWRDYAEERWRAAHLWLATV